MASVQSVVAVHIASLVLAYGLAVGVLLVSACGQDGLESAASMVVKRDSSGVHVVETPGRLARGSLGWIVSEFATLRIGCVDGPAQYEFHDIVGLIRGPDGGIVVVDGGSRNLRFFDSQGRFMHSAGREGRGPGEFISPQLIRSSSTDSIFIFDRRLKRLTTVGPEGRVGEVTPPLPSLRGFPMGSLGQHLVTFWTVYVLKDEEGRPYSAPAEYWIYDRANSTRTPLEPVRGRQVFAFWDFASPGSGADIVGRYRRVLSVPFDIMPSVTVGRERVFVTAGEGPEVRVYDVTGRLRRILRLDEWDRTVTQQEFDRFVDARAQWSAYPAKLRAVYARMPRPKVMPAFQSLIFDRAAWLWAGVYDPDHDVPDRWVVFDSTGVARGTVRTPDGLEIHQIGADFILGVERGPLGVPRVALFELDRNGQKPNAANRSGRETAGPDPAATACAARTTVTFPQR